MIALFFRILWQIYPSLWTCAMFWIVIFNIDIQSIRQTEQKVNWWTKVPMLAGTSMNVLVTLANNGRMPVLGKVAPFSVWVVGTGKHLLFLCDRFNFHGWMIFSIGDFFIFGSLALAIILWLLRIAQKTTAELRQSDKTP